MCSLRSYSAYWLLLHLRQTVSFADKFCNLDGIDPYCGYLSGSVPTRQAPGRVRVMSPSRTVMHFPFGAQTSASSMTFPCSSPILSSAQPVHSAMPLNVVDAHLEHAYNLYHVDMFAGVFWERMFDVALLLWCAGEHRWHTHFASVAKLTFLSHTEHSPVARAAHLLHEKMGM